MAEISNTLDDIIIGQKVSGCLIIERIGKGGMASVYRAIRDGDESSVAIKILTQQIAESDNGIARFQREARLMQSLQHPHILPVYEYGTLGSLIYLIMKLVEGGSLEALLKQGRLSIDLTLKMLAEITSALDYAHDLGVVHRDLKPANILLDIDGTTYLTDFGIAKWKEESIGLTLTGMVLGTPGYMAPEQWRTDPVDRRTDVYALGVMTFKMLTGRLPFNAETPFSLMYKHLDEPPPLATDIVPELEPSLDYVIQRALQKEPEFRYPTAGDFFAALQDALSGTLAQPLLDVPNPDEATAVIAEGVVNVSHQTIQTQGQYPLAVAVGARALINRGREALREAKNDELRHAIAGAFITYVQNLQERIKESPTLVGPYKALESYDISDNRLFFGREKAIDEMLARAPFSKFTVLHAESGAGKTSLIRAGLMPRLLAGGFLPLYIPVRISSPHEALKRLLLPPEFDAKQLRLLDVLRLVADIVGPTREIFIFFDQFETFFTDVFTDLERREFIQELAACIDDPLLQVRVTLAMRTEYFGLVANFQPHIAQPFEREYLLKRLTRAEAERALLFPAQEEGYTYESDLAERILDDLADENGAIAPPQLQLVGTALVEQLPSNERFITLKIYEAAGGAEGVLGNYLKRMLERLPSDQREVGRVVIENLVRDDSTRAVRTADELRAILAARNIPTNNLEKVLLILREGHLLRVLDTEKGQAYELVHDYLAQQIQVDPETAALRATQELLERRLKDYQQIKSLLTPEELNIIRTHRQRLAISPMAQELITISERTHRRQRRRTTALIVGTMVGLIGALAIGLVLLIRENENQQRQLELAAAAAAERDEKLIQESERLANLVEDYIEIDPMVALNLALAAVTPRDRPYVSSAEFALSVAVQNVKEALYLEANTNTIGAIWSPDETQILWWSRDAVTLTNASSGETIAQLTTDQAVVLSAAFGTSGREVLLGDEQGRLAFYTITDTFELEWEQPNAYQDPIRGMTWLSDQELFLVWSVETPGFNRGSTALWAPNGELFASIEGTYPQLSHNRNFIATRDTSQQVHLLDLNDKESYTIQTGNNTLDFVGWSHGDQFIVTWGLNSPIQIWDAESRELLNTIQTEQPITAIHLSSTDLIAALTEQQIFIWEAATGELVQVLQPNGPNLENLLWHPAGIQLLAIGQPESITLWNTADWQKVELPDLSTQVFVTDTFNTASWSPSGQYVTITIDTLDPELSSGILIWDTTNSVIVDVLRGHTERIIQTTWDMNERRLLSVGGRDQSVRLWRVIEDPSRTQYGEIARFISDDSRVVTAVWNLDETLVATGHDNGVVRIWNVTNGEILHTLEGHTAAVDVIEWSPNGAQLLSGSDDGLAIIWDVANGETLQILPHRYDNQLWKVWSADWHPNGKLVLTTSDDGAIRVWDTQTGEELKFLANSYRLADDSIPGTGTTSAFWSDDGTKILASSDDGAVQVWDVESETVELSLFTDLLIAFGAKWNSDESQILVWGAGLFDLAFAGVYDANSGDLLFDLVGHEDWIISADWNPDESRILTSGRDTTIRVWDAKTGEPIYQITAHRDSVPEVLWSPDGLRFLSRSVDGTVRVWEANDGVELYRVVLGSSARPTDIQWSQASNRILVGVSEDKQTGTARIINTQNDLDALIDYAESLITRALTPEQRRQFLGQ
ncbi:MAG: hypothetical protein CUN55_02895 [Phototrophicales bacterium]|nr:MAG: hypothetical protein CUN55_02895 [Phototrophicales bacterium]